MSELPNPIPVTICHPGSRIVTTAELLAWDWIDSGRGPHGTWVGTVRDNDGRVKQCPGRMLQPADMSAAASDGAGSAPSHWRSPEALAKVIRLADYRT
jgi:hypothetical protein